MAKKILERDEFLAVVERAPLTSVDFLIYQNNKVLLGKRNNRPAKGFWFVPGGRILKNENINDAILRILDKELSISYILLERNIRPNFLGVYQHFYEDCFAGDIGVSTHYVVLEHTLTLPDNVVISTHDDQHGELAWWSIQELLSSSEVHQYTKDYFL